ncbi:MAG: NAD(+)/NADH kinase [Deltaproteobacteria bacterium]|nr:NAD(+)/NADH kinase [Deltaproteobacteria bacterium]
MRLGAAFAPRATATPVTQPDIRRLLVVYKTSPYARYLRLGAMVEPTPDDADTREVIERLRDADAENRAAADRVRAVLDRCGLEVRQDALPTKREAAWADLVVTVGGDGTFLRSSHHVDETPMLGVNSAPDSSVGHYCGTTAGAFEAMLDRVRAGKEPVSELTRIEVHIGQRRLPHLALNDVLFCHRLPAASTRYILRVGDRAERQTSSGVWLSTASGSSGALRSAGGRAMEPLDTRLQFRVREPYAGGGETHLSLHDGLIDEPLELVARSPHLGVYLDGHEPCYRVGLAERVVLGRASRPLRVYGYRAG